MKTSIDQLGIFGGPPAFAERLHVGRPNIGNKDEFLTRVNDLLDRRWLTNDGPFVRELESRIEALLDVRECVVLCNGTAALDVLLKCLNLEGEVILPSFTFVSSAHVLETMNLKPVFCDVDKETHNLDPSLVEPLITPLTAAILGVHLWGRPCPIGGLTELANRYDVPLIFDAAHAFSCSYRGEFIGKFGIAEVLSFHATKFFQTFEGGAVVTNDSELANEVRLKRNFGFSYFDHVDGLGTNGKMPEISAAMGLSNLDDLDFFLETNYRNYECYENHLSDLPGVSLLQFDRRETNNYQYIVVTIDQDITGFDRDFLVEVLHAENVLARRYFHPGVHRMEPYQSIYPEFVGRLSQTELLSDQVMCLPTGTSVSPSDIQLLCATIKFIGENCIEIKRRQESP
ncbi:MAG: DegT/DnrJ/EryC1/StrS family aminotransferase [Halioglobus sp.]